MNKTHVETNRKSAILKIVLCILATLLSSEAVSQTRQAAGINRKANQKRFVTVNTKSGDSTTGALVSMDNDALHVELENGTRRVIKLDEVISINFKTQASKTNQATAKKDADSVSTAMKALRSISAAVEVGTTLREYRTRVIDNKIIIEAVVKSLSYNGIQSEAVYEIMSALDDYQNAVRAWGDLDSYNTNNLTLGTYFPQDHIAIRDYIKVYPNAKATVLHQENFYDKDSIVNAMWSSARNHIKQAEALIHP